MTRRRLAVTAITEEGAMAGFCCGIAVGALVVAIALAVGGHLLVELADGRLQPW